MKRSSSRRLKGVVLTTELVLLIIAIIIFATIAFFGIAKTLMSQASSDKYTVMPIRAEAWQLASGVAGTIYVQNVGSKPVTITGIGMKGSGISSCSNNSISVTLNPGEYKTLSIACQTSGTVTAVYIYVNVRPQGSTSTNEVGMAASVRSVT